LSVLITEVLDGIGILIVMAVHGTCLRAGASGGLLCTR